MRCGDKGDGQSPDLVGLTSGGRRGRYRDDKLTQRKDPPRGGKREEKRAGPGAVRVQDVEVRNTQLALGGHVPQRGQPQWGHQWQWTSHKYLSLNPVCMPVF